MKKYIFSLIIFVVGLSFIAAFIIVGSQVLEDGTVIEPFFLLPIGWLFIGISVILSIIIFAISYTRKIINR